MLRAEAPASARKVRFMLDGKPAGDSPAPFELGIRLVPGHHRAWAEADGWGASEVVEFDVE
jgi:hypothetical protein